jgi:hypothetical protein
MNFIVFLNAQAGELEKILSGTKSMLLKDIDPPLGAAQPISPGDCLYFLRHEADCDLRVKAVVTRVLTFTSHSDESLSRILKEMQARLQLTEDQFNDWSVKEQVMCIEFNSAHKIEAIRVALNKLTFRSAGMPHWIAFDEFNQVTLPGVVFGG